MGAAAVAMLESPIASCARPERRAVRQPGSLAVVLAHATDVLAPVSPDVMARAVLALIQMAIAHPRMTIEVVQRLDATALKTRLHANKLPAKNTNGKNQANGISSSFTGLAFALCIGRSPFGTDFRTRQSG
jgi:hypothetical protein